MISQVRLKLILLLRFLALFRSIDSSPVGGDVFSIGDRHWVVLRRKNHRDVCWEEALSLQVNAWCPCLCLYVSLTSKQVASGGPFLITWHMPFTALTSNTIVGLTSRELQYLAAMTSVFGPHTTRGPSVEFFRSLAHPDAVVATVGQWENMQTFLKHYLRVGAYGEAKSALDTSVCAHCLTWGCE